MADYNPEVQQEFFQEHLDVRRPVKIPGAYEKTEWRARLDTNDNDTIDEICVRENSSDAHVAFVDSDDSLNVHDGNTSEMLWQTISLRNDRSRSENTIQFSQSQSLLAIEARETVLLFDPSTDSVIEELGLRQEIRGFNFGDSGSLIVGEDDGFVEYWDSSYNIQWSVRPDTSGFQGVAVDESRGYAYVGNYNENLFKLDLSNGEVLVENDGLSNNVRTITVDDSTGNVIVGGDSYVASFDSSDLSKNWETSTNNIRAQIIVHPNGDIYAGDYSGGLYRIAFDTGSILQDTRIDFNGNGSNDKVRDLDFDSQGRLLLSTDEGGVEVMRFLEDASTIDETYSGRGVSYGIAVDRSDDSFFVRSKDNFKNDGRDISVFTSSFSDTPTYPNVTQKSEQLNRVRYDETEDNFILMYDREVQSRDATTGLKNWSWNPEGLDRQENPSLSMDSIAAANGSAYVTYDEDGVQYIKKLDSNTGSVQETGYSNRNMAEKSLSAYYDGVEVHLYAANTDIRVYKYDENLNVQWKFDSDSSRNFRCIEAGENAAYLGMTDDGGIHRIDSTTGQVTARAERERYDYDDIAYGAQDTIVTLDENESALIRDGETLEVISSVEINRNRENKNIRSIAADRTNGYAYTGYNERQAVEQFNYPVDVDNPTTWLCSIFCDDLMLNGERIYDDNVKENPMSVIPNITLFAGDTVTSDTRQGHIVGVKQTE